MALPRGIRLEVFVSEINDQGGRWATDRIEASNPRLREKQLTAMNNLMNKNLQFHF